MVVYSVHYGRSTVHGIFKRRISEKDSIKGKGDPVRKKARARNCKLKTSFGLRNNISRKKRLKKQSLFCMRYAIIAGYII